MEYAGHTEECILLICVIEGDAYQYSSYACFIGGVRPDAEKAKCGNHGCKEEFGFLKNKHFKNDEGSESILDQLLELEVVQVERNLSQRSIKLTMQGSHPAVLKL